MFVEIARCSTDLDARAYHTDVEESVPVERGQHRLDLPVDVRLGVAHRQWEA